jgi:transposase
MKYSYSDRLEMVKLVLKDGYSYSSVARLKGSNVKSIRHWVAHYQAGGVSRLCMNNRHYDGSFKEKVIRFLEENKLSLFATAIQFGIPDERLVRHWLDLYKKEGYAGFYRHNQKETPPMKAKKTPKISDSAADLQRELILLRAENAYLKKLQALVQARIARESGSAQPPLKN